MTKNEPTIKADDFVGFEGAEKPEKFTNFQELKVKVELLREQLDELVAILHANNLTRTKTIKASYFDDNELYRRLYDEE